MTAHDEAVLRTGIRRIYARATRALAEPDDPTDTSTLIEICNQCEIMADVLGFFTTLGTATSEPQDHATTTPEAKL